MAKIANNLTELIGGTPLIKTGGYSRKYGITTGGGCQTGVVNPAGSVKDRVGLAMIGMPKHAALKPGATIIEPTSGNTGVGLAMVRRPSKLSSAPDHARNHEHRTPQPAESPGAEIVLTDGLAGMAGSIAKGAGTEG